MARFSFLVIAFFDRKVSNPNQRGKMLVAEGIQ